MQRLRLTDKVDARILADLLRTDMIPECYIPGGKIRNLGDLARRRRRHYFVNTRTMFKNKVHVELSRRWIDYSTNNSSNLDLFTKKEENI
jgi:transposase